MGIYWQVASQGGTLLISLRICPTWRCSLLQGVRVEVNGQVLSQGGNLGADRITDTTNQLQVRPNPAFLPAAVIVGLQPGIPLQVQFCTVCYFGRTNAFLDPRKWLPHCGFAMQLRSRRGR